MTTIFKLLTFYKFVDIEDPQQEVRIHKKFLSDIWMKWRIYIWNEWISATVSGNEGQVMAYKLYLQNHKYFKDIPDIDVKSSIIPQHCFDKMIVKYRKEIVALGKIYSAKEIEEGGKRMSVQEFKDLVEWNDQDYVILDMRNDYEYNLWHFKWAVPAWTVNFRDLHHLLADYKKQFEGKKIISYCTGWIRCEKATVMLRDAGMDNVYQLDGGVVKYVNTYDDWNWLGNLYTFDWLISTKVGKGKNHTPIGKCVYSWETTDNCENCRYSPCNARLIAKPYYYRKYFGFCSQECYENAKQTLLLKDLKFDPIDYKAIRAEIKKNPARKDELQKHVCEHLDKHLAHKTFPHQKSLKEEFVIED